MIGEVHSEPNNTDGPKRELQGNPSDPMEDLIVNLAIWKMFMNTTHRAAVHLGKDNDTNLRFVKNYHWKTTGQFFKETEKLISGQLT